MLHATVVAWIAALALAGVVSAAAGDPDQTWGTNGVTLYGQDDGISTYSFHDVEQLNDGSAIAMWTRETWDGTQQTGAFGLAKFTAAGQLDSGWAADGTVVLFNEPDRSPWAFNLTKVGNDQLLVSAITDIAEADSPSLLFRVNAADGSLNHAWGDNGRREFNEEWFPVSQPGPDGSVLAFGLRVGMDGNRTITELSSVARRLTPTGADDVSYGANGLAVLRNDINDWVFPYDFQRRPDGAFMFSGVRQIHDAQYGGYRDHAVIGKLTPSGQLDVSYGTDGVLSPARSPDAEFMTGISRHAALADNTAVVAWAEGSGVAPTSRLRVTRVSADGSVVPSFGVNGTASLDVSPEYGGAYAITIDPSNRILTFGVASTNTRTREYASVNRFTADGQPDTTFGNNGTRLYDLGGQYQYFEQITPALRSRVLVVGSVFNPTPGPIHRQGRGVIARIKLTAGLLEPLTCALSLCQLGEDLDDLVSNTVPPPPTMTERLRQTLNLG